MKFATISLISLAFCSCSIVQTVTPKRAVAHAPSFDSSTPAKYAQKSNSGILELRKDASGNVTGAVVTKDWCDYVFALVNSYGFEFTPQIEAKSPQSLPGVSAEGDVFFCQTEWLDRYRQMSRWKHEGRPDEGAIDKLKSLLR